MVFPDDDHRLQNSLAAAQDCFDLAKFDTQAAEFHLKIRAAEVLEVAVRKEARQIPSLVQACARLWTEWISNKSLRGKLGPIQVSSRQLDSSNM